ncbi:MAG: aconitase family protein [Euryarchaeota archaeon]|nr:aconitase family protein [Euryarchaeota archaeon]
MKHDRTNARIMMREFARENGIALYENGEWRMPPDRCRETWQPRTKSSSAQTATHAHTAHLVAFATGMGSTDMAAIMAYGNAWLKVPQSYRIEIAGNLPEHVHSKDAFLYLCGKITADGATYMSMEFLGNTVNEMSVESRLVMCNMAIEAGGKCGHSAADKKVREFLARYGRSDEYPSLQPDDGADYASEIMIAADRCSAPGLTT